MRLKPVRGVPAISGCLLVALSTTGCIAYGMKHEIQGDSTRQIWLADASQVRVRNAQSRVFDTTDRVAMMSAVVATLQDLGFQIEVLDEVLGIVSAKQFLPLAEEVDDRDATYLLYDEASLVVFQKSYRTWGPFYKRSDLVRLTISVRSRNEEQLLVRASAQHFLRPVESPEPYQRFYALLEQTLFLRHASEGGS